MSGSEWVAAIRRVDRGGYVHVPADLRYYDDEPLAVQVVIVRASEIVNGTVHGLPDSDTVAHWYDEPFVRLSDVAFRFAQAEAMADGLNRAEGEGP